MLFGDIVLLDYPFTDASGSKRRPGLVLLPEEDGDILFARITSKEREGAFDIALEDWKSAGLAFPSIVRLSKMVSLNEELVLQPIGGLSLRDSHAVSAALERIVQQIRR